ncbi:MAG TPA: methionyl-tRNA formyltransferase [Solirubrobacteraceae bacterium]|nr:methionyl-tRNA formyltransferase [Solirubrobacteraceae bacterium]
MRTVYLGTSEFAAAVLERLAASPHRPRLVVTRPDRPRGRGRRVTPPPVALAARELGIEVDQPASVNDADARARIVQAAPDVVIVCAFGALIKEELLAAHRILNVHPSLLPRWRGAAPIERAIMAGDSTTGVSIIELTAGLDSGPVCLEESEPIGPEDTYGTLSERLQRLGGELLVRALDESPPCAEQDDARVTYADKITAADRELDPRRPADELERTVRALTPHIGAYVTLADGTPLGVREAKVGPPQDGGAGEIETGSVSFDGPLPVLATAEGTLELVVVQPPGKRPMPGGDYLRGRR